MREKTCILFTLLFLILSSVQAQGTTSLSGDEINAVPDTAGVAGVNFAIHPPMQDSDFMALHEIAPDTTSAENAPVGGTSCEFGVSESGAATFSIHIDVPKGINGMEPDLSLIYNSQGGNNTAGWGFGLSCTSSIRFVPRDIYHDGTAKPLTYEWTDGLALDGRRLILTSGTPGTAGATYSLEGDPFTKFTLMSDTTTNKLYFLMETPDGKHYAYGLGSSLQTMEIGGTEHYVAWHLKWCSDRHNHGVNYTYMTDENHKYIDGIYYDDKMIVVSYEDRPNDTQTYYIGNVQAKIRKRIRALTVRKLPWNPIYRTYTLTYDTLSDLSGTKYSRLTTVTESNGDGESLKPVVIDWNHLPGFAVTPTDTTFEQMGLGNDKQVRHKTYLSSDMNGDGISDLVYVYLVKTTSNSPVEIDNTYVFTALSERGQNGEVTYGNRQLFVLDKVFATSDVSNLINGMASADIDGDGLDDLVLSTDFEYFGDLENCTYTILTGDRVKNNCFPAEPLMSRTFTWHNHSKAPIYTIADFDRDGKSEIFHLETGKSDGVYKGYYLYNTAGNLLQGILFEVSLPSDPTHVFSGDFNNDGLTDIAVFCYSGYKVFFNTGTAHGVNPFSDASAFTGTGIDHHKRMIEGDFNGDGLPDFLLNASRASLYYLATCNGDGSFTKSPAFTLGLYDQSTTKDDDKFTVLASDLDHDGKADLIIGKAVYSGDNYSYTEFRWLRSTGTGFELLRTARTNDRDDARPNYIFTGDFSGNGMTELMNYGNNILDGNVRSGSTAEMMMETENILQQSETVGLASSLEELALVEPDVSESDMSAMASGPSTLYDQFHRYTQDCMDAGAGRVRTFTDAFGNVTRPSYRYLTDPVVYHAQDDGGYPINDVTAALSVVAGYTEDDGAAGTASKSFLYEGLKAASDGRGLLGFTRHSVTDNESGITVTTEYSDRDSLTYEPLRKLTTTFLGDEAFTLEETFLKKTLPGNYWIYPFKYAATDLYGNVTRKAFSYNTSFGVVWEECNNYDDIYGMERLKDYGPYVYLGGAYRPTSVTLTSVHPDTEYVELIQTTTYQYNNFGETTQVTENAGTQHQKTVTCAYDQFGNVASRTEQTGPSSYMTTNYTYAGGRDLVGVTTQPATVSTTFTYDTWGRKLTQTETVGDTILTATCEYDGWGNPVRKVSADGVVTRYKRGWGNSPSMRTYILEMPQGAPWVKTWYDSRGREVRQESVGPDRIIKRKATKYNSLGQAVMLTDTLGNRMHTDTLAYDAWGRLLSERHSSGGNTTYSYDRRTVTSVTDGKTSIKEYDAWGNLKRAVGPDGSEVTFLYGPNGKPREISSCGHTVTLGYDEAGNRTSLSDPDAGTSTWEYDNNGRVVCHTDPRGKVTRLYYDAAGNREREVVDGVATRFYYDGSGRRLVLEESGGYERRFGYDRYGRLSSVAEKMPEDTGTITKHYLYDTFGRVRDVQYPSGLQVVYSYDPNGFRKQVDCSGKTLWKLVSYTGRGERFRTLGDSLLTTRRYDHAGRLLNTATARMMPSGTDILVSDSLSYSYDPATSNLLEFRPYSRNVTSGTAEGKPYKTYTYDIMDRLTSSCTHSPSGTQYSHFSYGADGNILSKTGVGGYTYDSARPHAVTGVQNTDGIITDDTQTVTYNAFGKVLHIEEGDYTLDYDYGTDRQRWRSTLTRSVSGEDETVRSVRYCDGEDIITSGDSTYSVTYLDGGVLCIHPWGTATYQFYKADTDLLGSVTSVVKGDGTPVFRAGYDEWGLQDVSQNDLGLIRGYTGHEMLPELDLVNMNGRMYDPVLARFLSPDDYVQLPSSAQGFNRYAYCMNNPLKYVDPSGEAFGLGHIFNAAFGFLSGYLANAISTGNWGWKSVRSGLSGALSSLISYGFKEGTASLGKEAWRHIGSTAINEFTNKFIRPFTLVMGNGASISISPAFSLTEGKLLTGFSWSANILGASFGMSIGNNFNALTFAIPLGDMQIGYSIANYGAGDFYGNDISSQAVGTIGLSYKDKWSFHFSNDFLGDGEDRWRTFAAELCIRDITVGALVGTNYGKNESNNNKPSRSGLSIVGKGECWDKGHVFVAPAWIGFRSGNQIKRFGYSHEYIQALTQNVFHKYFSRNTPFFADYDGFLYEGPYSYNGYYNPYSLWNK